MGLCFGRLAARFGDLGLINHSLGGTLARLLHDNKGVDGRPLQDKGCLPTSTYDVLRVMALTLPCHTPKNVVRAAAVPATTAARPRALAFASFFGCATAD